MVVKSDDNEMLTGKMIESDDYWPSSEVLDETQTNLFLKKGDVFVYDGKVYIAVDDREIYWGSAKNGAYDIGTGWGCAYLLDINNVKSITDFEFWYGSLVIKEGVPGMIYYDDVNKIFYVTSRTGGWYYLPTKDSYDGWLVLSEITGE